MSKTAIQAHRRLRGLLRELEEPRRVNESQGDYEARATHRDAIREDIRDVLTGEFPPDLTEAERLLEDKLIGLVRRLQGEKPATDQSPIRPSGHSDPTSAEALRVAGVDLKLSKIKDHLDAIYDEHCSLIVAGRAARKRDGRRGCGDGAESAADLLLRQVMIHGNLRALDSVERYATKNGDDWREMYGGTG